MTKSKKSQDAAVAVLLAAGFEPIGSTDRKLDPLSRRPTGRLAFKGGRARLVKPGTALRVTVGKSTTWFYEVVNRNTRYMVNVPTTETSRIAFYANESRGEPAGGNSQMGGTLKHEENAPVNALPKPKRARRSFTRYLLAISIGVAATLAWQSYGEATKHIIARRAPQLAWSPEAKQMIASWIRQLGWTPDAPQPAPVAQTAPATASPMASTAPSLDLQQVQQIARDLANVRQAVEQLAARQDQMAGDIAKLQAADQEILQKISAPRPRSATVPAHIPTPVARPPIPLH